ARLVHPGKPASLEAMAQRYGLEAKTVPYDKFRGKRWDDLSPEVRDELAKGCLHDVELTWSLFQRLAKGFPLGELQTIDLTVRWFTEPSLLGDGALLRRMEIEEKRRKQALFDELGVTPKMLNSPAKFAKLLEAEGVEVEMKVGKNGDLPALAKTDEFMQRLLEDDSERVRCLAEARLEARSTIDETRSGRLAEMAERGPLPVYLSYAGARTLRWSGGDKVNFQNFRCGGLLRKSICAPRGNRVVVVDACQIECRILNTVAHNWPVVEKFRNGEDIYCQNATAFYGRPITPADKAERTFGKILELQAGYGAGGHSIVLAAGRATPKVILTEEEGLQARNLYRSTHKPVVSLWYEGEAMLMRLHGDLSAPVAWRDVVEIKGNRMIGPNDSWMTYELERTPDGFIRQTRNGWTRIWGGHLVENLIQYLARVYLAQAMLRV